MYKTGILALTAAALLASSTALAEDRIPGQVVIDQVDDISTSEINSIQGSLRAQFPGITFEKSDLVEDTQIYVAHVQENEVDRLVASLKSHHDIQHVEPNFEYKASFTPNDPSYEKQWGFQSIGVDSAWDYTTGYGVVVAVLDTGVACFDREGFKAAPDLGVDKCVDGWDFVADTNTPYDGNSHGTHCAGTISQNTNNGQSSAGTAYHSKIMPVKVLSDGGSGSTTGIADGIRWAALNGANIVSMSLGGGGRSQVLDDAIQFARSEGVTIIAAAGNDRGPVNYPARYDGVIGVSASDENGNLANFSSHGEGTDIAAPGTNIVQQTLERGSNPRDGKFVDVAYSGTSMSTPQISGVAALLQSLGVRDPDVVEQKLKASADDKGDPNKFGAGIVNASATVRNETLKQAFWRTLMLAAGLGIVHFVTSGDPKKRSLLNWQVIPLAFMLAVGLFALPVVWSTAGSPVLFAISRPLLELPMFFGVSLGKYIPVFAGLLPALMTVCGWHAPQMRLATAGVSLAVFAYASSLFLLPGLFFGSILFQVFAVATAAGCLKLAFLNAEVK